MTKSTGELNDSLKVLSAVAVMLVCLVHAVAVATAFGMYAGTPPNNAYLDSFGAVGVDMLLVIAGFLVAQWTLNSPTVVTPKQFFVRGITHFYPHYWAALLVFWGVGSWLLPPVIEPTLWQLRASLLLIPDTTYVLSWGLLMLSAWMLCLYVLFALLVGICLVAPQRCTWLVPLVVLAVLLGSRLLNLGPWLSNGMLLEPMLGWLVALSLRPPQCGLSLCLRYAKTLLPGGADLQLLGTFLLLLSIIAGMSLRIDAPKILRAEGDFLRALLWGVPAALLVLGAAQNCWRARHRSSKFFVALGSATFYVYLTHFSVLIALGAAFHYLSLKSTVLFIALALTSCAGVGVITVHLEKRLRDQSRFGAIP
jgi:exopolysaccharide production protein ExoZ